MKIAKVKTEAFPEVLLAITSEDKPEISEELQNRWQRILDLASKIIGVPSGLITRLHEKELEVFLTSKTGGNIFEPHLKLALGLGWYCENVTGSRKEMVLPNAHKSDYWSKDNPSIPFNMVSYMGIPIHWPDGEVFGTFCMLDNKENEYSELYKEMLVSLREIIQNDLKSIMLYDKARNDIVHKEVQLKEINHRIKNHFNLLISTINLQSYFKKEINNAEPLLKDIQSRIAAISMIHDKLYQSIDMENVLLGDYLNELGKHIVGTLADKKIEFSHSISDISVPVNVSLSCGLVLNELITNSLKYAFRDVSAPTINLKLEKIGDEIYFEYRDNGPGIIGMAEKEKSSSLGMTVIKHSANQLNASYKISNENGFVFRMKFNE